MPGEVKMSQKKTQLLKGYAKLYQTMDSTLFLIKLTLITTNRSLTFSWLSGIGMMRGHSNAIEK
jgi:hypothetical protein